MSDDTPASGPEADAVTDDVVAHALEQVRTLANENEDLRRQQADQRQAHIALLEANRELHWLLEAGHEGADGAPASTEWSDVDAKLQLLMTENNLLEGRERQAVEELEAQQLATRQVQLALGAAQAVAERAQDELSASDEELRSERTRAELAEELQREAERTGVAGSGAVAQLQRELEGAREEIAHAHADAAVVRRESHQWQTQVATHVAEATRREQEASAARLEAEVQLGEYRDRVRRFEADMGATERAMHQQLTTSEVVRSELVATQQRASKLEGALTEAQASLDRAAERETTLQAKGDGAVVGGVGGRRVGKVVGGGNVAGVCSSEGWEGGRGLTCGRGVQ